jgi:hypothetical protein
VLIPDWNQSERNVAAVALLRRYRRSVFTAAVVFNSGNPGVTFIWPTLLMVGLAAPTLGASHLKDIYGRICK